MIVLASFPRSGNTFVRNVLYEVYGLKSASYYAGKTKTIAFDKYPIVKTHHLPEELPDHLQSRKVVYLVRDGRDACVSLAHHRRDMIDEDADFESSLVEGIIAHQDSFFGGWSKNVEQWSLKADLILRFEEIIKDPAKELSKLSTLMDLPQPKWEKLPSFEKLKYGKPRYGGKVEDRIVSHFNFRRGKIGSWEDEMTIDLQQLFYQYHGATLEKMGYDQRIVGRSHPMVKRVLIEGTKFLDDHVDGICRYVSELIHHFPRLTRYGNDWQIDIMIENRIHNLVSPHVQTDPIVLRDNLLNEDPHSSRIEEDASKLDDLENLEKEEPYYYEKLLLSFKGHMIRILPNPIYRFGRQIYVSGPFRGVLSGLRHVQDHVLASQKVETPYHLVHAPLPQNLPPIVELGEKSVVTIHDVTHLTHVEYHKEDNIEMAHLGMEMALKNHSCLISISDNTTRDLRSHLELNGNKIYQIPQGIQPERYHPSLRSQSDPEIDNIYHLPEQFILCLSTIEPRKNLVTTIKAFLLLSDDDRFSEVELVIGGKPGWHSEEVLAFKDHPKIHFTGYIHDDHLPYIYAHASVFSYVSHYEGFGLPLLEAMGCGTPVVYGKNSSMEEIVGEHGLACDANDIKSIKAAYATLLTCQDTWSAYSKKSRKQASKYTWIKTAHKTLEVYRQIIEGQK